MTGGPATYNIIFAGVGGQGVITASGLLARAAIASGLDCRMYGSYGMAQRGGSVWAHLRVGSRVQNARIEKGQGHLLLGLDIIESVRWAPFLSKEGRLITHSGLVPPAGKVMKDGGARHLELLRSFPGSVVLDAGKLSGPAGHRGLNAVLLGAASVLPGFPVGPEALAETIRGEFGAQSRPVLDAFRKGKEAMK